MCAWKKLYGGVLAVVVAASMVSPVFAQTAPSKPTPAGAASPAPAPSPPSPPPPPPPTPAPPPPVWVVNFDAGELYAGPDADTDDLGPLRPFTYLQILGYEDTWAHVYNPRTHITAYISSDLLGPTDTPPDYITADPPPALEEINLPARSRRGAVLHFYPTPDPDSETDVLPHNTAIFVTDSVEGLDGELWYRTSDGDYLPTSVVRLPRPPPRTFAGRWIDADLVEPALLTAYEGDRVVMDTLTIHGAGPRPTPLGVFTIQRRVANETMNSDTIGIPRFGPGGYYLTNVLFTQYFTADGASIHYNYWSSNWGYAASHGCLGLTYADSAFAWNWAGLGTPVSVHY